MSENISVCGTDCGACSFFGGLCRSCNECQGCVPCAGGLRVPDLRLCAGEKGLAELRAVPRPAVQPLAKYP